MVDRGSIVFSILNPFYATLFRIWTVRSEWTTVELI